MFAETYTKFYLFMAVALLVGFVSMEVATSGLAPGRLSGMATASVADAAPALDQAAPGSGLLYLLIGVLVGAAVVATVLYVYKVETRG